MYMKAILSLFFCLNALGVAGGAVTYVSQDRSVSASNDKGSSASSHAADFDPFNAGVGVSWERSVPPEWQPDPFSGGDVYSAGAGQMSTLTMHEIAAAGSATDFGPFAAYEGYSQSSASHFEVVFDTTLPQQFILTGSLFAWGDYGGTNYGDYSAWVTLSGQYGQVFTATMEGTEGYVGHAPVSFDESLFLEPGQYTLSAGASAAGWYGLSGSWPGFGGSGSAEYQLRFAPVPAPGALLLGGIGITCIGWLRKRGT